MMNSAVLLEGAEIFNQIAPDVNPEWSELLMTSAKNLRVLARLFDSGAGWQEVFPLSSELDETMREALKTDTLILGLLGRNDLNIPEIGVGEDTYRLLKEAGLIQAASARELTIRCRKVASDLVAMIPDDPPSYGENSKKG